MISNLLLEPMSVLRMMPLCWLVNSITRIADSKRKQ